VATSKTDSVSISNRLGGGLIGEIIFDPGGAHRGACDR
jgi:hypothetical protein